jgi:hypothetical protein
MRVLKKTLAVHDEPMPISRTDADRFTESVLKFISSGKSSLP